MNEFDKRRIGVASLITVSVLALVWVFSTGSSQGGNSAPTTCVGCADTSGNSAPSTTEYEPHPPLFVGGDSNATPPDPVVIATSPEPDGTEFVTTAQFVRFLDATDAEGNRVTPVPRCSTKLAPDGALLTVTNVDNGQWTTCTNTQGVTIPPGVGMVLGTDVFAKIGDLVDAPLPVRVSWDPDAPLDLPDLTEEDDIPDTVDTAPDE